MNRQRALHLGPWILLLLEGASGCRRVDAAPSPYATPPTTTGALQPGRANPSEHHDTDRIKNEIARRDALLRQVNVPGRLEKPSKNEVLATKTLTSTFARGSYLPAKLLEKITVSRPLCGLSGCYVDVTYPDVATFAAVDQVLLHRQTPFTTFPGPRYRTGQIPKAEKLQASWVLTFSNDGSYEGKGAQ
jgi:hypothetical protein